MRNSGKSLQYSSKSTIHNKPTLAFSHRKAPKFEQKKRREILALTTMMINLSYKLAQIKTKTKLTSLAINQTQTNANKMNEIPTHPSTRDLRMKEKNRVNSSNQKLRTSFK
ncbi:hypothetical protein AABB24_024221 [Solanum stoloniferum]|uniref:Uncharacterized protein n=1 Tax=Solanum stoloniferum TaxID=62892 RepID=A0ABD2SMT5_9SOLN